VNDKKDLNWLRRASSFWTSRIILTANNYRIFDLTEGEGKTAAAVAKAISCDKRATELLLNSLSGIGLLKKRGGKYINEPVASSFLVKGKPGYQGNIIRHYNVLWDNWSGLDAVLKTGQPFHKSHDHESFILGMHDLASLRTGDVLRTIDLRGVGKLLDLGGGPGTYSMGFAKRKVEVTLFDSAETLRISEGLIKEAGLEAKIRLMPGDFMRDDLGSGYDMVFISQIFHAYGPDECVSLLRKCRASLSEGGRVVVQEFYLDETKAAPLQGALFAINMLVNTPHGRTYTPGEMSSWMKRAGFTGIDLKKPGETVLITGRKNTGTKKKK